MKLSNLQPSFPGSFQYIGPLFRVDEPVPLTLNERIATYGLKTDRADVIIPAAEIFLAVAKALKCEEIHVPNISLADGIIDGLYKQAVKE